MLFRASIVVFSVILALVASPARADIVLTVGTDTFVQDSGVQTLNVVARTTGSDSLAALTADFQLGGGVFEVPPGTFGQLGMIGAGNLDGASSFLRDVDTSVASLSLDFGSSQPFPTTDTLIATLSFDIDGLSPGNYSVTFLDVTSNAGAITSSGNAGSFTISAVPEPSAAALLGVIAISTGTVVTVRKRFRRGTPDLVA